LPLIAPAQARHVPVPAAHPPRKEILVAAARPCHQLLEPSPHDGELRKRAAQVYRYTANVHRLVNETAAADPLYQDSIRLYEGLADQFPEEPVHREKLSETLRDYSSLLSKVGRLREATDAPRRGGEAARAPPAPAPPPPA